MHKIYFILMSCLLQSSLYAMKLISTGENNLLETLAQILPTDPHIDATNNCGQTRLHLTIILAEKTDPASLETCKSLIRQGASIAFKNTQDQTPLYLAAVNKASAPLTRILLTTCPSIKPELKTLLLSCRRWKITIPKDVFLECIVPYIIFNETETKLAVVKTLLTEILESKIYRPNPMAARNVLVQTEKRLCDLVKTKELQELLDPKNIEQLRPLIIQELYASIGITIAEKNNAKPNV